jgi:multiple sugar transport system substrate-binding protein
MARAVTTLIALLATAAVVAACGSDDGGSPATRSSSVQFLVFGEPEELKAYRNVIAAYSKHAPGQDVRLVEASDRTDLITRLSTSFAAGNPPDLFLLNYRFYGQFAARGVLEPVEDRVNASSAFEQDDFYPQAMEAFRWEGKLTCLPQNISSLVVYYNRDLFKAAGLQEPPDDWHWNDMVEAAKRLTKGEVHGLGVEPSLIRLAPFVWSNGGEVVDDLSNPKGLALQETNALQAASEFFKLSREHGVIPTEAERKSEDEEARFQNGRIGMLLSSRRSTPTFRTITAFDWDIAPLPRLKEPAGILHSDAYCMTKASKDKDAAWRFLEFALGPEGQKITAASGRTVPSLKAVAESEAFLDPNAKPSRSRVFLDTIPHIRRVPTISTWPEIEDASEGLIEFGLYDDVPANEVLGRLDAATRPIFGRAQR